MTALNTPERSPFLRRSGPPAGTVDNIVGQFEKHKEDEVAPSPKIENRQGRRRRVPIPSTFLKDERDGGSGAENGDFSDTMEVCLPVPG